jgi:hypothetical protein
VAAELNLSLKTSSDPKLALIAARSFGDGAPELFAGVMIFQKKEWFHVPPALLRTAGGKAETEARILSRGTAA